VAENKTKPTAADVQAFLETVPKKLDDAMQLVEIMRAATGAEPVMWGGSIIGFGEYDYLYESGRSGTFALIGFSPRKAKFSLYLMDGFDQQAERLARLGKHKVGKSCLYINKLADVDLDVLREMVQASVDAMRATHTTR